MKTEVFGAPEIEKISIPDEIDGYIVTAIGSDFDERYMRTDLKISFPQLTEIEFPKTLKTLKPLAFVSSAPLIININDDLQMCKSVDKEAPEWWKNVDLMKSFCSGDDNELSAFLGVSCYVRLKYKDREYIVPIPSIN